MINRSPTVRAAGIVVAAAAVVGAFAAGTSLSGPPAQVTVVPAGAQAPETVETFSPERYRSWTANVEEVVVSEPEPTVEPEPVQTPPAEPAAPPAAADPSPAPTPQAPAEPAERPSGKVHTPKPNDGPPNTADHDPPPVPPETGGDGDNEGFPTD